MIYKIKSSLKKNIPGTLYDFLYHIYSWSLSYYLVNFSSLFFRYPSFIKINNSNLQIYIDPQNGFIDKVLFLFRERDGDLIELMKNKIKKGDIVIDVGANIGYETLWAANITGEKGSVYSFEPLTKLVGQIGKTLKQNNLENVFVINKAVSDKIGEAKIYLNESDSGLASIEDDFNASGSIVVPLTTLDIEIPDSLSISFIKIDVEGHEFEVLKGAINIIKRNHPLIVFEFSPLLYEKSYNGKSNDLLRFLLDLNYKLSELNTGIIITKDNIYDFTEEIKKKMVTNIVAEYKVAILF